MEKITFTTTKFLTSPLMCFHKAAPNALMKMAVSSELVSSRKFNDKIPLLFCCFCYFFKKVNSLGILLFIKFKRRGKIKLLLYLPNSYVTVFPLPGTVWTASAHIITAVIGSGVLSLAWATAQLGWIAGPAVMFLFSFVTYYTSTLLAACYRSGDPVNGQRNYTYMDAVRSNLGKLN